jgi:predicted nucleic-acid-binding Zn-ribbon protein
MSDKQQIPQPVPSACPECGTMRVVGEGLNSVRVRKIPSVVAQGTDMWALVCPNCGYTSFYAKEPHKVGE